MKSTFNISSLLKDAGEQMSRDLRQRLVTHPGEAGRDRESIIRNFLASYLPKRFDLSTGFAFDSSGRVSKQLDIIIADSHTCSKFETIGGTRYYPCESIVAVGQVRTSIASSTELLAALENLESVKSLDRSGNGSAVDSNRQEQIDHTQNHLHQIFTFLFITDKALKGVTVREILLDFILKRAAHLWPNIILANDNYMITYCCEEGICPNPMHARGIALQPKEDEPGLLIRFYLLLGRAIEVTRVSSLPYTEYLQSGNKWSADVIYRPSDDGLPPFLSSL